MGSTSDKTMEFEMKNINEATSEYLSKATLSGYLSTAIDNQTGTLLAIRPANDFLHEKTEVQMKDEIDFYMNKVKELRAQLEEKQKKYKKRKLKGLHDSKK